MHRQALRTLVLFTFDIAGNSSGGIISIHSVILRYLNYTVLVFSVKILLIILVDLKAYVYCLFFICVIHAWEHALGVQ